MSSTTTRSLVPFLTATSAALLAAAGASGGVFVYSATLNNSTEIPPVQSNGTGTTTVTYDSTGHTLHVVVSFTGLTSGTTASHIHATTALPLQGTAGVATTTPSFVGFPLGVTSGDFDSTLDLTLAGSWNPAFITANGGTTTTAEAALVSALSQGKAYLNIHTSNFPGGEIRGFLVSDCYANCDGSTTSPILNVADFTCFLQRFAAGDGYANCDFSTTPPVLNVADFTCFLQKFAAGCPG
jgi:hypothetical protein